MRFITKRNQNGVRYMSSVDTYECSGQMNLFDFIEPNTTSFCWDKDINEILESLKNIAEHYGLEIGEAEFKIWDHVPHLGYRLWVDIKGTREELGNEDFQSDISKLVAEAKQKNVELTPMWGACMFFNKDDKERGRLAFTTMFTDKARQRRKK